MYTADDIRFRIGQLNAAKFERFCCVLLARTDEGQRFRKFRGSVNADGETTKGTPDATAELPSGKYAAFQFTVQRKNIRRKLLEDIAKIADPTKCSVSDSVEEVILGLSSPLPCPHAEYETAAKEHGWLLTIYALDDLLEEALKHPDLCERFLDLKRVSPIPIEAPQLVQVVEPSFRCGSRVKVARRGTNLSQSEFIELVGFHSETDFARIEGGKTECPASLATSVCDVTGVHASWLKHGKGTPYAAHMSTFDLRDIEAGLGVISDLSPRTIYVCLDRWFFNVALVVRSASHRWNVFELPFQIDVHQWIDCHGHIGEVYQFLHQLFERFDRIDLGSKIESRVFPWITYRRLIRGTFCPGTILTSHSARLQMDQGNHWADDLRDISLLPYSDFLPTTLWQLVHTSTVTFSRSC